MSIRIGTNIIASNTQYTVLPTPSATILGKIVQYIGSTTASYTQGYFYQCVASATEPITYSWDTISVQPSAEPSIVTLTTASTELVNNTVFNGAELASVTLTVPATMNAAFTCHVNFSSGTTPTTFTIPNTVYLRGDECVNGAFNPAASKRYSIMFMHNGVDLIGFVCGK